MCQDNMLAYYKEVENAGDIGPDLCAQFKYLVRELLGIRLTQLIAIDRQ